MHSSGSIAVNQLMRTFTGYVMAIAILVAGAAFGLSSVLAWVHQAWWSFVGVGVYSHGYLVFALALWIGWRQWKAAPPHSLSPCWWGLLPLAMFVLAMTVLELTHVHSSRALLLPPLFLSSVLLVFGRQASQRLFVGAMFTYFGLLPWWMLDPSLQSLATAAVSVLMSFSDTPFYIEGLLIHVPAGTFEIAASCSGLSFLLSAVILAVFYGIAFLRWWRHKLLLLTAAMAAALVSNWIRIWTLVLIGEATELKHWLIDDHYAYGWVLFVIGLLPVLFFARKLEDREDADRPGDSSTAPPPGPPHRGWQSGVGSITASLAAALMLAIPSLFADDRAAPLQSAPLDLPARMSGGAVRVDEPTHWQPQFHNARQGGAVYRANNVRLEVFQASYPRQTRDAHLFHGRNRLFPAGWREIERTQIQVVRDGNRHRVNEVRGTLDQQPYVIYYWYEVAGRQATDRLGSKLAEYTALPWNRRDGSVIAVAAACGPNCSERRSTMRDQLAAIPSILEDQR